MNSNMKASNNTALNSGSFIQAPINTIKNAAANVANSIKNTVTNIMPSDISEQINDSINTTLENTTEPLVTIPVIIALGILIILFIIVIIFREQIALGLQLAWEKMKDVLGISKPVVLTPVSEPPQLAFPAMNQNVVEKILPGRKEVFNIAQNKYSYSDSEPLCKAFGAELASYDQVKEAWKKGADWCNYGWVKGQAAVFPTQESTFNKLQSGPEDQRMSCGVAGINGGYFDNPELRFGVNCYGTKPSENEADNREIMNKNNLTPDAIAFDKKVFNYKSHKSEIPVNPFSHDNWSS
jgi:hypothetical protein